MEIQLKQLHPDYVGFSLEIPVSVAAMEGTAAYVSVNGFELYSTWLHLSLTRRGAEGKCSPIWNSRLRNDAPLTNIMMNPTDAAFEEELK